MASWRHPHLTLQCGSALGRDGSLDVSPHPPQLPGGPALIAPFRPPPATPQPIFKPLDAETSRWLPGSDLSHLPSKLHFPPSLSSSLTIRGLLSTRLCKQRRQIKHGAYNLNRAKVAQMVKNPPAMQKTWVRSLGWGSSPSRYGNPLQCSCLENPMHRGA